MKLQGNKGIIMTGGTISGAVAAGEGAQLYLVAVH